MPKTTISGVPDGPAAVCGLVLRLLAAQLRIVAQRLALIPRAQAGSPRTGEAQAAVGQRADRKGPLPACARGALPGAVRARHGQPRGNVRSPIHAGAAGTSARSRRLRLRRAEPRAHRADAAPRSRARPAPPDRPQRRSGRSCSRARDWPPSASLASRSMTPVISGAWGPAENANGCSRRTLRAAATRPAGSARARCHDQRGDLVALALPHAQPELTGRAGHVRGRGRRDVAKSSDSSSRWISVPRARASRPLCPRGARAAARSSGRPSTRSR